MAALLTDDLQTYAFAAIETAILLAFLWIGAWAVFWRGTATELARLDAELQRQKYQVSASAAEARRIGTLLRSYEEKQSAEPRYIPPAPRPQTQGFEMAIRMARSGATEAELAASCGMSKEEASLMRRLHGSRARDVA